MDLSRTIYLWNRGIKGFRLYRERGEEGDRGERERGGLIKGGAAGMFPSLQGGNALLKHIPPPPRIPSRLSVWLRFIMSYYDGRLL